MDSMTQSKKRALLVQWLGERNGPTLSAPLSFAQERLWFLEQLHPGGTAYQLPIQLPLWQPCAIDVLRRALEALVARHESLRTTFAVSNGIPMQRIAAVAVPVLIEIDCRNAADPLAALRKAYEADNAQPFDLQRGPLFRAALVRLPYDRSTLLLNMHHIISDGWSCDVLQRELRALIAAFSADLPSPLPPLPIQYRDFAVWQRDWLRGDELDRQCRYWTRQLADAPDLLDLPTDRPRPAVETHRGAYRSLAVSSALTARLQALARDCNATLFMILLAIFQALLARTAGVDDIVVGSPSANRNRPDLEPLIGFFVNMLPLRARPQPGLSVAELIAQVRQTALEAFQHQDLPFERLVDDLHVRRSLSHAPVFQTAFVLQSRDAKGEEVATGDITQDDTEHGISAAAATATKYDLTLSLVESAGSLRGSFEYRTDLFAEPTITRLLQRYLHWLELACADSAMPLGQLPLLSDEAWPFARVVPAMTDNSGESIQHNAAAAASVIGLNADGTVAVADGDFALQALGRDIAAAAGAAFAGNRTRGASHVLLGPETLSALSPDTIDAAATLVVVGLPCFDSCLARWRTQRRVGLWLQAGRAVASLDLDGEETMLAAALPGETLCVIDAEGRVQAVGLRGEIACGGLMRGVGIAGRWREDGRIEYFGPIDRLRTIDGMRVDPERLRALLRQHPGIAEARVDLHGEDAGQALTAFVVPRAGRRLDDAELARYVQQRLPAALIPRRIAVVDALPDAVAAVVAAARPAAKPRTPVEAVIGRIWTEVLKRPQLDIDANFFDQGGNSLTSVQVIARIRDALHVDLSLHRLFEAPTIAELAQLVESERVEALEELPVDDESVDRDDAAAGPQFDDDWVRRAPPGPRRSRAPLSYSQERMWFLDQLSPGATVYHMGFEVPLPSGCDPRVVQRALSELVRRHEALRTTFPALGGVPQQLIAAATRVPLKISDLSHLPADRRDASMVEIAAEAANQRFDLANGPLLRARYLRCSEDTASLAMSIHHIVFDGWSFNLFMKELRTLIEAFSAGETSPLPELPVQYADFARWQRRRMSDDRASSHLHYWRDALADAPKTLSLPCDRPRPVVERHIGAQQWFAIESGVCERLRQLARGEKTTVFCVLLAAFSSLLMRLSGQEDILIGTPVANRTRVELEGIIGFLANTLVLRNDLSGDPSFRELLARTRRTHLAATEHQEVPFEKIVEALHPQRSLNHNPLFQVMLVLQNSPEADPAFAHAADLWHQSHDGDDSLDSATPGTAKFDLTLTLIETPGGLVGGIEYNTDLFEDITIARWLRHFRHLLAAAVIAPDTRIWALPLMSAEDQIATVEAGRGAPAATGGPCDLLAMVENRIRQSPTAVAIAGGGRQLDYAGLDASVQRLANALSGRGAGPGRHIALSMPRCIEALVAVLAIARTGAVVVPIDPAYPQQRRDFMLDDSAAVAAVVSTAVAAHWRDRLPCIVLDSLDGLDDIAGGGALPAPAATAVDDAPLYLLYTSGSTGVPKGVRFSRRALANLVRWHSDAAPELAAAKTLQFSPLSFDVSFQEIFLTWCGGGTLLTVDAETRADPAALLLLLCAERVERLFMPYVALQQLAEAARGQPALPPLREIVTAGEQLRITPAIVELFDRLGSCRLRNQYGPTESHVVSDHVLEGPASAWPALPPIGRPIDGAHLLLLDRYGCPVPRGTVGELYIGGVGVALGYHRRDALNSERFLADPFSIDRLASADAAGAGRMYRSGDLARLQNDGSFAFIGRADQQLKVRGYRVEPGEIESALTRLAGVDEAVVVVHGEDADSKRLIAYVLGKLGSIDSAAILEALAAKLPDYLLPSLIVAVDALPATPSGKIDRAAVARLPLPVAVGEAQVAPSTPLERLLAGYFVELLGVAVVGADADFFELGGHSLLATRLLSKIGSGVGLTLSVRQVFETPTVRRLAAAIVDALVVRLLETRSEAQLARLERNPRPATAEPPLPR